MSEPNCRSADDVLDAYNVFRTEIPVFDNEQRTRLRYYDYWLLWIEKHEKLGNLKRINTLPPMPLVAATNGNGKGRPGPTGTA